LPLPKRELVARAAFRAVEAAFLAAAAVLRAFKRKALRALIFIFRRLFAL
jgi:hypothetical protein